jgi:MscS family membrane protein
VWKDGFIQSIYIPLSSYVWFFAAVQAFDVIATRVLAPIPTELRHTLLAVGAVLALGWFLLKWKFHVIRQLFVKSQSKEITLDPGKIGAIDKIWTVAILLFTGLLLLETTDRSMNTLIAFGGIGGLALAFASQEIIANFFGGFMIYLTQPFTIGDWISIPDHSIEGIVEDIGWYMTSVRSMDKRPVYIPNSIFSKLIVITPSRMSHRQFKETIGLRYEDLSKVQTIVQQIKDMLHQHPDIDHSQSIIVRLATFGEYSLDVSVSAYISKIDNENYMKIKEDILLKIAAIVLKNDAEIATPVHSLIT